VTKGALQYILSACSFAETATGTVVALDTIASLIQQRFGELSGKGFRVLGVACRDVGAASRLTKEDEVDMTFLGFLVFFDSPKLGINDIIAPG
jgi:P-type Mg2+ transporter